MAHLHNVVGARLKKSTKSKDIKLKLRGKRFLYTLILKDSDKADKIKQSLPPSKSDNSVTFWLLGVLGYDQRGRVGDGQERD